MCSRVSVPRSAERCGWGTGTEARRPADCRWVLASERSDRVGPKVLVIEDEETMAEGLAYNLGKEGFEVSVARDGEDGIHQARERRPDLVLLDLMLPRVSGLDVCRALRQESNVAVIMLTARTSQVDKVVGLELGADDYLTKPFSLRELIARIRAVMRRASGAGVRHLGLFECRGLTMDFYARLVKVRGRTVELPPKEYDLLYTLATQRGRTLSREDLIRAVWSEGTGVDPRTVDVHVRGLRERIEEDPAHPEFIRTVRGVGYRFDDEEMAQSSRGDARATASGEAASSLRVGRAAADP
ncbi:MAG: response regulator transcription factor [Armatimonadetes bacterium]|nr:response regulator transcription factor [Armatimonadota bacterium]